MKTFCVDVAGPESEEELENLSHNSSTRMAMAAPILKRAKFKNLFAKHYPAIAPYCAKHRDPGLVVVAIDERRDCVAATAFVAAKADRINAFIVGRHTRADMHLRGSGALSLRHLAVIVERPTDWHDLSFRVLDLRSTTGFEDGTGKILRGLRCEGPATIRCDHFTLFFFRTSDSAHWPDRAKDAWDMLPEPVYFDELTRLADGSRRYIVSGNSIAPQPVRSHQTRITRTMGPVEMIHNLIQAEETCLGTIAVDSGAGQLRFGVGETALEQGVLVGRYQDRCAASALMDVSVSRVHLLIIKSGDTIYAIDTGSTNGTYLEQGAIRRVVQVSPFAILAMGCSGTRVAWSSKEEGDGL